MVWLVLAGMAACAVLAALWPLLRPSRNAKADPAANEAAFYKAQLEEIRRDVERGLLPQGEAESARAEAARRLIATASSPVQAPPACRRSPFPFMRASASPRCPTSRWRAAKSRPS
jgi:cytochrome c-type biogenesis protein CcmH